MFMNKKSALAVSIALLATVSTGTATAKTDKGSQVRTGTISVDTRNGAMQSAGSPQVFPNEYVSVNYSGSFRYSGGAFKTCNVRADPCNYYPGNYYQTPLMNVNIPGHSTVTVKGRDGRKDVVAKASGVVSTALSDNPHSDNSGTVSAKVNVFEACYEQEVRARIRKGNHLFANIFMSGNWCSAGNKISSKDPAILEQVRPNSVLYVYRGSNITSTRWWPSSTAKKQFKTILYPQIQSRVGATFSIIGLETGIIEPALWFEYRHDGHYRVRVQIEDYNASSGWMRVSDSRSNVDLNISR